MPKSRKRRLKRSPRATSPGSPVRRALIERFGEKAPYIEQMLAVDEAERRGEVLAALDLIKEKLCDPTGKLFWRTERIERLLQLAMFGSLLPGWATSRWLLEQAAQELGHLRNPAIDHAFQVVADVRGGLQNVRRPAGEDPRIKVMDHDWVFRQCLLYDFGALASYLQRVPADLLARADRIEEWCAVPMGGYRCVARTPAVTFWVDVATGESVETPNIGSAALLLEGEWVIGRVVPIEEGRMFETLPLQVPESVARAVAGAPVEWIQALRDARGRGEKVETGGCRFGFLSDVRREISALTLYDDLESVDQYRERADRFVDVVRCAFRDEPTNDPDAVDVWACIGAELLTPHLFAGLVERVRPDQADLYARLGSSLAEPAARMCRVLAVAAQRAA
jgi:hypothetical protein